MRGTQYIVMDKKLQILKFMYTKRYSRILFILDIHVCISYTSEYRFTTPFSFPFFLCFITNRFLLSSLLLGVYCHHLLYSIIIWFERHDWLNI